MSTAVAGVTPVHGFHGSEKAAGRERGNGFFIEDTEEEEEGVSESSSIGASSSESSSIGENSSSEAGEKGGEEEEEEVESKAKEGLGSLEALEALEDSLPIKRGLSNFYAGKSKSFTSLAEAAATAAAKEIEKPENPFNKRRRVLAAWSRRRASCSSLATAYLPPLLAPDHAVVEEEEDDDEEEDQPSNYQPKEKGVPTFPPPRLSVHTTQRGMVSRSTTFRSPRSFSLSDLHNASYNQL